MLRFEFRGGVMKRRDFITLVGGVATVWPLAARAQQPAMRVIGFLGASAPSTESQRVAAFVQRLRELGWIDGRNLAIEYRWAEGRNEHYAEIAAEFIRLKVDVIVTEGTPPTLAAKQATAVIPIVFAAVSDPVGTGLVASLARPGANATGLSNLVSDTVGKKLEFLREIVPGLRRLAIMVNVSNPASVLEMGDVKAAARTFGLEVATSEIRRAQDIASALDTLKGRADALYVCPDPLVNANRVRINTLALGVRLPTMHSYRAYVDAGGLMSYGPNIPHLFARAAELVDKILRGTKPGDIPVEQPTQFELVVNLKTAKALGLAIPETFLLRTDEVIE
jgi:putative tryptophan/tyrosine transport system substrate-binding protein